MKSKLENDTLTLYLEGRLGAENAQAVQDELMGAAFIDVADEVIGKIANDLCTYFHQETVLVTSGPVKARVIRGEASIAD